MGVRRGHVLLVMAGLLTGCGSGVLHGGKLGPRVGVQVGYLMPIEEGPREYGGGVIAGMALRSGANLATPAGFEIGAAFSRLEAPKASVELYSLRARGLYAPGAGSFCLSGGMQVIWQSPTEYGTQLDQYVGGAIDLGFVLFYGRRVELGLNYSMLMGSENVPATADATIGINF